MENVVLGAIFQRVEFGAKKSPGIAPGLLGC